MLPCNLRCCLLHEPRGLDRPHPELSWELQDPRPGSTLQTAWRIVVASSRDKLTSGIADLWDTGRQEGSQTCYVAYAGEPLQSRHTCFWKVWLWDENGNLSESSPASWSMGLLSPSDWTARWIGLDAMTDFPAPPFTGAQWIWTDSFEPGEQIFEKEFVVAPEEPRHALLFCLADDEAEIFINGGPVGQAARAQANSNLYPLPHPIGVRLGEGANVVSIRARKRHDRDNFAGVILRLCIGGRECSDMLKLFGTEVRKRAWKGSREIVTDDSWKAGSGRVRELGSYGVAPWHLVTPEEYPNLRARYLRKGFEVKPGVRRAVLYYSGLGLSEAYLNGERIGDEVLAPHATDYAARVFYRTFEINSLLQPGENVLGCILGNGRFFAPRSRIPFPMETYGCPKLLAQLEIDYEDGSRDIVASDQSWKIACDGAIGWNNEFDGEWVDARKDDSAWLQPGFDDSGWTSPQAVAAPLGVLEAPATEPIRAAETITLKDCWTTKYGTKILDFGVNLVGWCSGTLQGEAGDTVRLAHSEALDSRDALNMENLRSAQCTDVVVLKEGETRFEPRFTYHGFRYVEVRGERTQPEVANFHAKFVHDDVPRTGEFQCSSEVVNRIVDAAARGILGNYRSMPTDCPQRDERMGWLGDRAGGAPGEMFLFDVQKHYRKWVDDIRLAQMPSGCIPDIAPPFWRMYSDNVTWPSCMVFIPHWLHRHYGDRSVIEKNFGAIGKWLDHMCGYMDEGLLSRDIYGDWCVPPESRHLIHSERSDRKTSPVILASSYLARNLELGSAMARIIGRDVEAGRWKKTSSDIARSLHAKFFDPDSKSYDNGSQTASLLPLAFGITPEGERRAVFNSLVERIEESGEAVLGTGLIGGQWLMRTLTAYGRGDVALALATREEYPGWGYMIRKGATTIWELWNGDSADPLMNSSNHVMLLGDLVSWLYEDVAGIQAREPGFARIGLRPHFLFERVECSHRTIRGSVRSAWELEDGEVRWTFEIPANVEADVELPAEAEASLKVDGIRPKCIRFRTMESPQEWIRFEMPPGRHHASFRLSDSADPSRTSRSVEESRFPERELQTAGSV